jgi:hypothetical protein
MLLQVHRLAMKFGRPDVDAFLQEMTAPQMWHWLALNNIDPWTNDRQDLHSAIVATVIANTSGSKKKFKIDDFMPDWIDKKKATNTASMAAMLTSLFKGKT